MTTESVGPWKFTLNSPRVREAEGGDFQTQFEHRGAGGVKGISRGRVSGHSGCRLQNEAGVQAAKKPLHWPLMPEPRAQTWGRKNRDHSWGRERGRRTTLSPMEETGDPWLPGACLPHLLISLWAPRTRELQNHSQAIPGQACNARAALRPRQHLIWSHNLPPESPRGGLPRVAYLGCEAGPPTPCWEPKPQSPLASPCGWPQARPACLLTLGAK